MKKSELKKILLIEVDKFSGKSFEELSNISTPLTYVSNSNGKAYQVEVGLLEKNDKYVHIVVAINDRKILRWMFPISTSFIV